MTRTFGSVLLLASLSLASAQAPAQEEFEAAAVKPFAPNPNGGFPIGVTGGPGTADPGRIIYKNYSLKYLLMFAYNLKDYQIVSPDWMNDYSARFVIEATVRPGATKEQVNQMLANLLLDRFKMTVHKEQKESAVHELTVARNGPKLTAAAEDPNARPRMFPVIMVPTASRRITAKAQTMDDLAVVLSDRNFGPVLDKTGLTGKYDFTLEYATQVSAELQSRVQTPDAFPDLTAAIQQQLGLRLDAKKEPIEILVVDHSEKQPADN